MLRVHRSGSYRAPYIGSSRQGAAVGWGARWVAVLVVVIVVGAYAYQILAGPLPWR